MKAFTIPARCTQRSINAAFEAAGLNLYATATGSAAIPFELKDDDTCYPVARFISNGSDAVTWRTIAEYVAEHEDELRAR